MHVCACASHHRFIVVWRVKDGTTQSTHYAPDLHPLNLHPQSLNALAAHFSQFPQTQRELEVAAEGSLDSAWDAEDESSASHANATGQGSGKRARNGPPPLVMRPFSSVSPSQAAASCAALAARIAEDAELAAVQENRARLPVNEFRDEIMRHVAASQVVLIAGATGHGPLLFAPAHHTSFARTIEAAVKTTEEVMHRPRLL